MFAPRACRPRSSHTVARLVRRSLVLCLVIMLMAGQPRAQTDQAPAAAERLYAEVERLYAEGSRESLGLAIRKLVEVASICHAAGDTAREAVALSRAGRIQLLLGEQQQALDSLKQVARLTHARGDAQGEGRTLSDIGAVYDVLGDKQQALDYFNQALQLLRAAGDVKNEATALDNIGMIYNSLDERQRALEYLRQAEQRRRAIRDADGMGTTLNNLGGVARGLGNNQQALAYFNQALPFLRAVGSVKGVALTFNNIGGVYLELGETEKALAYYTQALSVLHALPDGRVAEATALNNIGEVYRRMGESQKALDYYNQALLLCRAISQRGREANTLVNVAYMERERGDLRAALADAEAAINILESLRATISSQELRASYFATVQDVYAFYIDLLMRLHARQPDAGYDGKALQASERARARSLLETLAEANADIRQGVDAALLARERTLRQQLNAKARQQTQLLSGQHTEAQTRAVAGEVDALTTEFQQVEAQIRQTSPRYAALTQPAPLTLREIQTQVLAADTVLLEYSLGKDRSYLWAVTPTSINSYELPGRAEIETAAREFYAFVHTPPTGAAAKRTLGDELQQQAQTQAAQTAARLSRMLLAPAAALLGQKRLLVVADGTLQYVPFAALPAPGSAAPLVVEHEIVSLPSASTLALLRRETAGRKPAPKLLAVLADPVFERADERLKASAGRAADGATQVAAVGQTRGLSLGAAKSAQESGVATAEMRIPRLPATRREADEISKLVPPAERQEALDFAASRAAATDPALGAYRFIHFATHGMLDSQHPELSGILLSMFDEQGKAQDGFLRAHEVFNLKLGADVVVLSACQTGLGKEIKGEGLVGLTRGFMYAGAPRVVVSLWSVADEATAELMTRFYRGMLVDKLRPAQALQAAQVSLLRDKRFNAPFYWAAFTLQGEWR